MKKKFATVKQAMEAYVNGTASLDDVSDAADRTIEAYFARSGRTPTDAFARRSGQAPH